VGAINVAWGWTPATVFSGSTPLAALFPGDAYVDWVGVDGYNFGALTLNGVTHTWQTFDQVFAATITELEALSRRPVVISEVGCSEVGGSKAGWITAFLASIRRDPRIAGFVWFDHRKETDWRIESSQGAEQAFRRGVRTATYQPPALAGGPSRPRS
jgi:hypothetical protein